MRFGTIAVAIAIAASLTAYAAGPAPGTTTSPSVMACAGDGDAENLCNWDSAAGTHGRKCTLDVERIDRKTACNYDQGSLPSISDHKPMCFSVRNAEHIAFSSGQGRSFRVRRLIPISQKNAHGRACPKDPFTTTFDPKNMNFGASFDSATPKSSALGCQYKLEVQFRTEDASAPPEPNDPDGHHYECRDPHLKVTN